MLTIHTSLINSYPEPIMQLIGDLGVQALDPGTPNDQVLARLAKLKAADLFPDAKVSNQELAEACRSGLYLAANDLETSHNISQDLPSSSGSYWHAIMHRREPDYSNSGYWFRKVGTHPIFADLPGAIQSALPNGEQVLNKLVREWDPYEFNTLCEQQLHDGEHQALCQEVQAIEWALLFDYCYKGALA